MKFTIVVLFIFLSSICFGQTLCDGKMPDSSSFIFTIVDKMPEASMTEKEVENILNSSIELDQFKLEGIYNIFISFIVNCRSEDFYYNSPRSYHRDFEEKVISILQDQLEWKSGKQRGDTVDVQLSLHLKLYNNKIEISGLEK